MTDVFADIVLDGEISIEDPDTGRAESWMNGNHRYDLPHPDGRHKANGWMRMTNLAGAFADQRQLQEWELRTQLLGIHRRPDIIDQLIAEPLDGLDDKTRKSLLSRYATTLKDVGGGNVGAARGNMAHAAVEAEYAGVPLNLRPRLRAKLDNYLTKMASHGLVTVPGLQERIVLLEEFEVAGKLDNVVWDQEWNIHRIADLKTQRAFYSWLEIVIQLKGYTSAPLIWEGPKTGGRWVEFPVPLDPSTGIVAWMPHEHPDGDPDAVDIFEVEIWHGRRLLELAHEIVKERAAAKSKTRPWAGVRGTFVSASEAWSRRLAEAQSMDELRQVWAGVKLAGFTELLVPQARERFKEIQEGA